MSIPPTIKQLQYLQALATSGNFLRAANKCNVSQSTLSAGIMEMENLLGLPVIDRKNRKKTTLTPFGEDVLKTANNVLDQMDALTSRAKNIATPLSGPFRLGLIPTIAPYLLPTILPQLQKAFPKLEIHITEDLTAHLIDHLEQGLIDLAILAFPYETPNLKQVIFYEEPFFAAAKKGAFKKEKISTQDLENHHLLLLEDGHCLRDHALSACKIELSTNQKSLSATSLLTLIQMAAQGNGITLLPEMVIKQGFLPKSLELTPFKTPKPTRQIGAAWRERSLQNETIKAVLQTLKNVIQ
jgi:LysR family hydrogen peroxide-inducible transcriptional activator